MEYEMKNLGWRFVKTDTGGRLVFRKRMTGGLVATVRFKDWDEVAEFARRSAPASTPSVAA